MKPRRDFIFNVGAMHLYEDHSDFPAPSETPLERLLSHLACETLFEAQGRKDPFLLSEINVSLTEEIIINGDLFVRYSHRMIDPKWVGTLALNIDFWQRFVDQWFELIPAGCMEFLLRKGIIDPNGKHFYPRLLTRALLYEREGLVELLLTYGADYRRKEDQWSIYMAFREQGDRDQMVIFRERFAKSIFNARPHIIAMFGHLRANKLLAESTFVQIGKFSKANC